MIRLTALLATLAALAASPALALDKVSFGLNWVPEAEHCGFFQAKATGLYEQAGLDVELRPGNPNVNMPLLVASGELDMGMGSSFTTLNLVAKGIKARTVAAFFQKDPQTLVAHAGQGVARLEDLKGRPIMVGGFSRNEFWQFLKARYGFTDEQLRPFAHSAAPFLADKRAVQQGYITEDAALLGKALPEPPVSILLADYGYDNYATSIFATETFITAKPKLVRAFVEASRKGWEACMAGDYEPAMRAVLALVPTGGEDLFRFKMDQMKRRGLVDGGDAARLGLGAMTDARWRSFFDVMTQAGLYPASLDVRQAYTLDFLAQP
ncbi:putative ABC transporter protein, periplasmic substrate-binding component precursor [Methylorubrum extorquens DM4]|uniref:ABC transporter protein, periplasmic substrate-binding component n=1 Tax=Methylorubrum extorquens (strain DSM 6343 / CIP 106787 / DM4) TaxID=661410 RepID=C7CL48_METED|nr:ABC transporter substrate-binding protein [Methylorubrum extorquens]CAX23993.1 putative ABC transporter protein, periplasmic substrate-binding component precursor [Methylorubrum extorquens DM4]